jgi:hypothetical protein
MYVPYFYSHPFASRVTINEMMHDDVKNSAPGATRTSTSTI